MPNIVKCRIEKSLNVKERVRRSLGIFTLCWIDIKFYKELESVAVILDVLPGF